ncbi:MAG: hypothetical protein H6839_02655 [Planctomycetes bacterium]|nr:hypothetical protein [Planctomycetota bacterium]
MSDVIKHVGVVDRVYREIYHDGEFDVVVATTDDGERTGEFVSLKSFATYCGLTVWDITGEAVKRGYSYYYVGPAVGGVCLHREDFERMKLWCIREGMKKLLRKARARRVKRKT